MSALLQKLNSQQKEAVTLPNISSLILAGAGSGKTRVLTTRIAWLIDGGKITPNGILAVTFTNKAAKEMSLRISNMLPVSTRGMWIGTFHGICNRLLRLHFKDANLPKSFQILDSNDQISIIKRVIKLNKIDIEKISPKQIQYHINSAKDNGLRSNQIDEVDEFTQHVNKVYRIYQSICDVEGLVDFGELILRTYELFKNNNALREHYQNRFKYLLVDEFQDTNQLQYNWLRLLVSKSNSIFAVGDDDQSIYGFRGARSDNLSDFKRDFNVSNTVKLEQNYRSQGHILEAANALIKNNVNRLGKDLWTSSGQGEQIKVLEAPSESEEANSIVREIKRLESHDHKLEDIAIFYRSNAQSRPLEQALFRAGIAYKVYGGLRFFERQEIKHALAYLRLILNPQDHSSFLRIINFPPRGIGSKSIEKINKISEIKKCSLFEALSFTDLSGKAAASIKAFSALFDKLRVDTEQKSLAFIIETVINDSGLVSHYENDKDGFDRIENLKELINAGAMFEIEEEQALSKDELDPISTESDSGQSNSLFSFLDHASLEAGETQAVDGAKALQLMTVHAAKGLEFQTVFLTGLEEGLFPHENSLADFSGLEEERRLMYVAVTRAKKNLNISFAQSRMIHGQTRWNISSRFLDEIPQKNISRKTDHQLSQSHINHSIKNQIIHGSKKSDHQFSAGKIVEHQKFGMGIILQCEGQGPEARVQINFENHGVKWLILNFAKLTLDASHDKNIN